MLWCLFEPYRPGCVGQSVACLTHEPEVRYLVVPLTFISPSTDSRRTVVSNWRKCVHEVLVNLLGILSLPRKSVVRLTDRPDMTIDVYHGCITTTQQLEPSHTGGSAHWIQTTVKILKNLNT